MDYGYGYADWKGWSAETFGRSEPSEVAYFEAELRRAGLWPVAGKLILEIGFGNGAFLAHVRKLGAQVIGTEANTHLVEQARAQGFDALNVLSLSEFSDGGFDGVVLFDVLEHIEQAELSGFLCEIARVLRPGGVVIARFPNGDSPLSLAIQNGDLTHITYLGSAKIRVLLAQAGLRLTFVGAPAPVLMDPSFKIRLLKILQWLPRKLVENAVKLLFFPRSDFHYFSANLVISAVKGLKVSGSS